MALPKDLKPIHIEKAVEYVETQTADLIDLYLEQANVFSAIVGIFGAKGLHAVSPYKKHKHPDVAQQRFPDLSLHGKLNPPPEQALESRAARDRGQFNRTTIIRAGMWYGVILLIPRSRLSPAALLSSGAWTWLS